MDQTAPDDLSGIAVVLHALFCDLANAGLRPLNACVSPILGGRGAIEFLAHFDAQHPGLAAKDLVEMAMEDQRRSPPRPVEALLAEQTHS